MTAGLPTRMLELLTEAKCSSCVGTGRAFLEPSDRWVDCPVCRGTRVDLDSVSFRTMLRALPACLERWEAAEAVIDDAAATVWTPANMGDSPAVNPFEALRLAQVRLAELRGVA